MASTVCNALSASLLSRRCLVPGGVKTRMWVGQVADIGARTFNTGGALSSFVLAAGSRFITVTGRARKGSGASKITKTEDGAPSVEQTLVLELSYNTAQEAKDAMNFLRSEFKTVFLESNGGTIRQYFAEFGDQSAEGDTGTGTVIGDASNILKITLKGTEQDLPLFFESVLPNGQTDQLVASRTYLDALVTP